jgi:hypothetical protein
VRVCECGGDVSVAFERDVSNMSKPWVWRVPGPDPHRRERIAAAELPCREVVDRWPQRIFTAASRQVSIGKLACQAVFVISFYDLSRPVTRPPFSVARTNT